MDALTKKHHCAHVLPDGVILQTSSGPSIGDLLMNREPNVTKMLCPEWVNDVDHYWNGGEFVEYPPRPSDFHVWVDGVWIDPRLDIDIEEELQKRRDKASISRADFIIKANIAGLISETDAIVAAKGDIPESFEGYMVDMTAHEKFEAKVRWAASVTVNRMDPFIAQIADKLSLSDVEVDALFDVGIEDQGVTDGSDA